MKEDYKEPVEKILTISEPNAETIGRLVRAKFTGLTFHPGREQMWDVWRVGRIIKFCATKEEAVEKFYKER